MVSEKIKLGAYALGALILAGSAFSVASGEGIGNNPLVATVISAFSSSPTIVISRDPTSPQGTVYPGNDTLLAVYDITARNVPQFGTVHHLSLQINITSAKASPLTLSNVSLQYSYCIPSGKTYGYGYHYGYGWPGGNCGYITLPPSSVVKKDNGYFVTVDSNIPIFPQASQSLLYVMGTPSYAYTGDQTSWNAGSSKLKIRIQSATATAEKCKSYYYGYQNRYGYSKCNSYNARVLILGAGNTLTVERPYGYGYHAFPNGYPPPLPPPTTSLPTCNLKASPASISLGDVSYLSWSTTNASSVSFNLGVEETAPSGSIAVSPSGSSTYVMTAHGQGGTAQCSTSVNVSSQASVFPTASISQDTSQTVVGQTITINWNSSNADSCVIGDIGPSPQTSNTAWATGTSGSKQGQAPVPGIYHITIDCTGHGHSVHQSIDHTVITAASAQPSAPPTCTLSANPPSVPYESMSQISWSSTNATTLSITYSGTQTQGISGSLQVNNPAAGSASMTITNPLTFTGTATGPNGSATCSTQVSNTQASASALRAIANAFTAIGRSVGNLFSH